MHAEFSRKRHDVLASSEPLDGHSTDLIWIPPHSSLWHLQLLSDPKPKNETVLKLRLASWIWFSGRKRRRRNARETTQRGADRLRLAASGRGQEGRRSLSGDGGIAASVLQLETAIRRSGIAGAAGTSATARREPQAERDRSGPHVGQGHFAGSAIKKGLKPVQRRELVRQVRQAYRLSEKRACGLMRITRWSNRYQSRRDPQTELRIRLRDLAGTRIRYGYRRLTVLAETTERMKACRTAAHFLEERMQAVLRDVARAIGRPVAVSN